MTTHPETWLCVRLEGLFWWPGGFYVDPLRAVERAVFTHAHSDHARPEHRDLRLAEQAGLDAGLPLPLGQTAAALFGVFCRAGTATWTTRQSS